MSSASPSTYGAAASTLGLASAVARIAGQPSAPAPKAASVACEVMSIRLRSSGVSKPFITDSTTMNTATPIATPSIDISDMNDRKPSPDERR